MIELDLRISESDITVATFSNIDPQKDIRDIKIMMHNVKPKLSLERQSYRTSPSKYVRIPFKTYAESKALSEDTKLSSLLDGKSRNLKLYFKDLGPQVGWTTVFLTEYAGPLVVYALIWYLRQPFTKSWSPFETIYTHHLLRIIALICWSGHYIKRLLETIFVHRFSQATMPISNIFKNSIYYWGFAAFVAYFVNHPLYTFPSFGWPQVFFGLSLFLIGEIGNFSCHIALRNLRPPGTKIRKIPQPTGNMFTNLFNLVACPNYTYEVLAWCGFSIMTQSLPAAIFTFVGFYQMTIWAKGKLRNYRREFHDFPRNRKAIIPFFL